ncbi:hypothetical protein EVAR_3908_1 [Eumeta japonica]|uniref:Uncharacterized protein n=1 Tax=Eumeta variegata TaxID=151549 RepID=A0A4C1SRK6_EUMVA|nr:hypothetical protein EVAR_3908_1 [Eumeta japonica]
MPFSSVPTSVSTPKQDDLKSKISVLEAELNAVVRKRDTGLGDEGIENTIKKLRYDTDVKKNQLQNKIVCATNLRKFRVKQKSEILSLKSSHPNLQTSFLRTQPGRPSLKENQSGLLQVICDITTQGISAADRRRSEVLRTCKTLDELYTRLVEDGFSILQTSAYRRLIPKYSGSLEALRKDIKVKPEMILSVDGGPDENLRYNKVVSSCISHFKEYDLDGLFVFTNAPGRSAYNRVERRMAPLSRELATVVLPYEHYGSHLDSQGKAIDSYLELKNFQHASETLAEIWSQMVIDGHNVIAECVPPGEVLPETAQVSDIWYRNHVCESQYFPQIIKCSDNSCCSPRRSALKNVLYQSFLPTPFSMSQNPFRVLSPDEVESEIFPSLLVPQFTTLRPDFSQDREIP